MKKLILVLLLPATLFLQSCEESDVALSVGFVSGVIVGSSGSHGYRTCHGGYYTTCSYYINRWGERVRDCRQTYDYCYSRWSTEVEASQSAPSALAQVLDPSFTEGAVTSDVAHVATKYDMGFDGAQKIVSALNAGQNGDLKAIQNLGFSKKDLARLSQGEAVSDKTIQRLSENLNLDLEQTKAFVVRVQNEVQQAK